VPGRTASGRAGFAKWLRALTALIAACCAGTVAQELPDQRLLKQAVELHQSGQFPAAIEAYTKFLNAHPDAAAVRSNLGAALAHEGRMTEAIAQYNLAVSADPANRGVRFNLALAYYKTGDIQHAVQEFEAARAGAPPDDATARRASLLLGECYVRQGNDKPAIEVLDPVAAADPTDLAAAYLLGTALIRENQAERGAVMIQRILRNGDSAEAHMLMAFTKLSMGDKPGAIADAQRAIELNPQLPEAHNLLGRMLFLQSDLVGAEAAFRRAIAIDGNLFEPLFFLGALLRQQGRNQEAAPLLERALQIQPGELRARYQYAILRAADGHNEQAASMLESLIKDVPNYAEAHRSLSKIYFRLGRAAEGRREIEIAEKLNSQIDAGDLELGRKLK
jgi:tetratricopeptide (TPR) repeat protein